MMKYVSLLLVLGVLVGVFVVPSMASAAPGGSLASTLFDRVHQSICDHFERANERARPLEIFPVCAASALFHAASALANISWRR